MFLVIAEDNLRTVEYDILVDAFKEVCICDTTDGVSEQVAIKDVVSYMRSGIEIFGLRLVGDTIHQQAGLGYCLSDFLRKTSGDLLFSNFLKLIYRDSCNFSILFSSGISYNISVSLLKDKGHIPLNSSLVTYIDFNNINIVEVRIRNSDRKTLDASMVKLDLTIKNIFCLDNMVHIRIISGWQGLGWNLLDLIFTKSGEFAGIHNKKGCSVLFDNFTKANISLNGFAKRKLLGGIV